MITHLQTSRTPFFTSYDPISQEKIFSQTQAVTAAARTILGNIRRDELPFTEIMRLLKTPVEDGLLHLFEMRVRTLVKFSNLSEKERYEIALYVVNHPNSRLSIDVFDLGVTNQEWLLKLALIKAEKDASSLQDIHEWCLEKQEDRVNVIVAGLYCHPDDALMLSQMPRTLKVACLQDPQTILYLLSLAFVKLPLLGIYKKPFVEQAKEKFPSLSASIDNHLFQAALNSGQFVSMPEAFTGLFPEVERAATALLPDLKAKVAAQKDAFVKVQLERWLYNQQMRLYLLTVGDMPPQLAALSKELMEYRDPTLREHLSQQIALRFSDPQIRTLWLQTVPANGVHALIPTAVALLCSENELVLSRFAKAVKEARDVLRVASSFHLLVKTLFSIAQKDFSLSQKEVLLNQVFVAKEDVVLRLRHLAVILLLGQEQSLLKSNEALPLGALMQLHKTLVTSAFEISLSDFGGQEAFFARYEACIEKRWRDSDAPLIYAGKIESLQPMDQKRMKKVYGEFLTHYLKGTLHQARFATPHFARLNPLVVQKWVSLDNETKPLTPYLPKESLPHLSLKEKFQLFLRRTLQMDTHVPEWQKLMPFVSRFCDQGEKGEALLKELSALPVSPLNEIQRLVLTLLISEDATALKDLIGQVTGSKMQAWATDLNEFERSFRKKAFDLEKSTIGVTRSVEDMMLVGRETGGCQSIDGDPKHNKCALAYMYDGKNLLVYVRGDDGKLKARALLRLLFHKESGKEVLFLERPYTYFESALSVALVAYAKEVAASLNLPLLTKEGTSLPLFGGTVLSFGSNAPYEYSDAGGGVCPAGIFQITAAFALFLPAPLNPLRAIHDPNTIAFDRHFNLKSGVKG